MLISAHIITDGGAVLLFYIEYGVNDKDAFDYEAIFYTLHVCCNLYVVYNMICKYFICTTLLQNTVFFSLNLNFAIFLCRKFSAS